MSGDPHELAPWFEQLLKLDERKRRALKDKALELIQKSKPEAYDFIRKFKCELVGFCPRVEYTMVEDRMNDIDITWIHPFSIPTLLYWCKQGQFGFFVNANLSYNESVLERVPGNKVEDLKGFTG